MNTVKVSIIIHTIFLMSLLSVNSAFAHFGMVIPSDNMVMQGESGELNITLSFSHPFEMVGMTMEKPEEFFMVPDGSEIDLKPVLKETKVMDHKAWTASYTLKKPGVYNFVMIPAPYWEPAEDCFIIHYTKTVVAAFGGDEGWDAELGLKTEIVPLTKPFGLYAGNVFQGIVMLDGAPVPYAEVEVEYYNKDKKAAAPTDYMVTQTIKADGNGVFTYATPAAGWWGFAALSASDKTIQKDGEAKDVELGAVIWVKFENWK
jgi:cobalt/nickel transport protein